MAVSKIGTLISQNKKLASLYQPYSEYYPYYKLGIHFEDSLREFLKGEEEYVNTLYKTPKPPYNAADFLAPHDRPTVDLNTCKHLAEFLNRLMGREENFGDRSKVKTFDFTRIGAILKPSGFSYQDLTDRRVQDFWLSARRCTGQSK